jgi:transcriptional regulator with XRE-family HTH domain
MTTDLGSTVPRRQLGRYLRKLREDGHITVKAAADALEWSPQKIWRIENGAVAMRSHDVKTMCEAYGASAEMTEALMGLALQTKARGWWHSYGRDIPRWFELYVGLEAAAGHLRQYESELVPGILQTKAIAREMIRHDQPGISEEECDRQVTVRLERQSLLTRRLPPPPQLDVVINEAVLRRPVGDHDVMAAQLQHIIDMSDRPNVSVRVLPFGAGHHRGAEAGAFVILDFPANGDKEPEPPTVYCENVTGSLYLDEKEEVATYRAIWADITTLALGEPESRERIKAAVKEYEAR